MHAANAAASNRHWNVLPASFEVNVKVALVAVVTSSGPPVMVVSGGVVSVCSMTQLKLAGDGSVLVAESIARTSKV